MDVYHKVLNKLYETTEGKNSKAVDFKNLVKQLGFTGHYADIFSHLSGEGWIADTPKADYVTITHWGSAEAKKTAAATLAAPNGEANARIKREINQAAALAGEISAALENLARAAEKSNLPPVEKKMLELQAAVNRIKENLT